MKRHLRAAMFVAAFFGAVGLLALGMALAPNLTVGGVIFGTAACLYVLALESK